MLVEVGGSAPEKGKGEWSKDKCVALIYEPASSQFIVDVEGQEHAPIKVAIAATFLFYRYKFMSRATCTDYWNGQEPGPITDSMRI